MSDQNDNKSLLSTKMGFPDQISDFLHRFAHSAGEQIKKQWVVAIITCAVAVLCLWICLSGMGGIDLFSSDNVVSFDSISCIARNGDHIAVIDSAGERLCIIEYDGNALSAKKLFYTGNDFSTLTDLVITDSGRVVASNVDYGEDGVTIVSEQVKEFSADGSVSVLESYEYDVLDENYSGRILDMWTQGENIGYIYHGFELMIMEHSPEKGSVCLSGFSLSDELMTDAVMMRSEGDGYVYINTGSGDIYRVSVIDLSVERIFSTGEYLERTGTDSFPFCIDVSDDGAVYYLDAADKTVKRLSGEWQTDEVRLSYGDTVGTPRTVLQKMVIGPEQPEYEGWSGYYTISVSDDGTCILTSCSNLLIALELECGATSASDAALSVSAGDVCGKQIIKQGDARQAPEYTVRRIAAWLFSAVLLASLCYILYYLLFEERVLRHISSLARQIILMVAGILICSIAACMFISEVYVGYLEDNLSGTIENAANISTLSYDGEDVKQLSDITQYKSAEYMDFYHRASTLFSQVKADWSTGLYIGFLYEHDHALNVLFYSDDAYSPYIPLGFETDSQFYAPYQQVKETGRAVVDEIIDYSGKYLYALAPLTDNQGDNTGFLELGTFAGVFREKLKSFAFDTAVTVIGLVAVLLFLFVEISFAWEVFTKRRRGVKPYAELKWPRSVVRVPSFLSYFVANITLYLMPIIMLGMVGDGMWGLSPEAAAALPLTLTMAGILVASISSPLYMRFGWKLVSVSCFALTAVCFAILAFSLNPIIFILTAFFIGFANGANYMGMYEFICASGRLRGSGETAELISTMNAGMFAGASCGVVVGTFLYDSFGALPTFLITCGISALTAVLVGTLFPAYKHRTVEDGSSGTGMLRFIFSRSTLFYGLLLLVPVTITTFFVLHFIPLYFEEEGLSPGLSSLVYLLNGMIITFLGSSITKAITRKLGLRMAAVLSSVFAGVALIFYSISPTIALAVIIAVALGLTEAFGQSTRIDYFSDTPEALSYGKTEAAGVYNAIEGAAQLVGPSIFSFILVFGVGGGMLILGGAVVLLGAMFLIIAARDKPAAKKR